MSNLSDILDAVRNTDITDIVGEAQDTMSRQFADLQTRLVDLRHQLHDIEREEERVKLDVFSKLYLHNDGQTPLGRNKEMREAQQEWELTQRADWRELQAKRLATQREYDRANADMESLKVRIQTSVTKMNFFAAYLRYAAATSY